MTARKRRGPGAAGWVGIGMLGAFVALAALGPALAPYRVTQLAGAPLARPDRHHWVGTNSVGQDIGSQLAVGARTSLVVAIVGGGSTLALGAAVGVAAGWLGGLADAVAMRAADLVLVVPTVPLLVVLSAYANPGTLGIALIIALTTWPVVARVVRSEVLSLRQRGFVEAAVSFGARGGHILRRHIVPGVGLVLVAGLVTSAERAITIEAGLAFLGLINPTQAGWGSIMRDALDFHGLFFTHAWAWWLLPPVIALCLLLLALTLVGTSLDQRLNPRLGSARAAPGGELAA